MRKAPQSEVFADKSESGLGPLSDRTSVSFADTEPPDSRGCAGDS